MVAGLVTTWTTDKIWDDGLTIVRAGVVWVSVTTLPVGGFEECVDGAAPEGPVRIVKVTTDTPG